MALISSTSGSYTRDPSTTSRQQAISGGSGSTSSSPSPTTSTNRAAGTGTTYTYGGKTYTSEAALKEAIQANMRFSILPDIAARQEAYQISGSSSSYAPDSAAQIAANEGGSWYQTIDSWFGGRLPFGMTRAEAMELEARGLSDEAAALQQLNEAQRANELQEYYKKLQEEKDKTDFLKSKEMLERQQDLAKTSWYEDIPLLGRLWEDPQERSYQEALNFAATDQAQQALYAEAKMKGINLDPFLQQDRGTDWGKTTMGVAGIAVIGLIAYGVLSKK